VRAKEIFAGPRLRARVPPLVRARAALALTVFSVAAGAAIAAALAAGIGFAVQAVLHAVRTGG
jgi:hypothetical protein